MAMLAVWSILPVFAQHPKPHAGDGLAQILAPRGHARAPQPNRPSTPTLYFDATTIGTPVVLDKGWRVGITSDPAAARPDFDDSKWAVRDAAEAIEDVPEEDQPAEMDDGPAPHDGGSRHPHDHDHPFVWFRLHIKLAPGHGPLALLIELPVPKSTNFNLAGEGPSADVFADGVEIRPEGPHGDNPGPYQSISRLYKLNIPTNETTFTLAVRSIYIPFGYAAYTSFFADRTFRLGSPGDLGNSLQLWSIRGILERLPRIIVSVLLVVLAVFLFALYFNQKGHLEYLWLALHELAQAPLGFIDLAGSTARLTELWYGALLLQFIVISAYLYFEFLVSFLELGKHWAGQRKRIFIKMMRYSAPILAGVGPLLLLGGHNTFLGVLLAVDYLGAILWMFAWVVFCFITLIAATIRRNFEAGLLLFPLILSFVGILEPIFTSSLKSWSGHPYTSPLTLQAGPVPIHFASVADFIGMLAIVLIIFVRFLRIQRDQERASSELAAARSVQELMIPEERISTPGFEVDSIYNPANEVGGDFYHVQASGDGGLLVVIGDVAGKGLKAAMNVSMLVGALRHTQEKSPAKILESLNRVLVGGDSFTTCQAAWFNANGELILANAGHLPPYLNTQEIGIPGGLPLGVIPEVKYEEVRLYLHPGDRLLLMSDGVVEARHASGELFGFERVHNLSNQSAFYIADAAKAFGQEDDITVLTVRRLAMAAVA